MGSITSSLVMLNCTLAFCYGRERENDIKKDILLSSAFPQRKYDVTLDFAVRFSSSSTVVSEEMFLIGRRYVYLALCMRYIWYN